MGYAVGDVEAGAQRFNLNEKDDSGRHAGASNVTFTRIGKMVAELTVGPGSGSTTFYEGPVMTSVFAYAGRAVRMVRPSDPDRLLDDPGVLA